MYLFKIVFNMINSHFAWMLAKNFIACSILAARILLLLLLVHIYKVYMNLFLQEIGFKHLLYLFRKPPF